MWGANCQFPQSSLKKRSGAEVGQLSNKKERKRETKRGQFSLPLGVLAPPSEEKQSRTSVGKLPRSTVIRWQIRDLKTVLYLCQLYIQLSVGSMVFSFLHQFHKEDSKSDSYRLAGKLID